jgi:hypothetical protein
VSRWDDELGDWDVAQNMGFPFSSTGNDYLFYNTPCGNFSVMASDRESTRNQVTIYAVMYEALPLKSEILEEDAAAEAKMEISKGKSAPFSSATSEPL